VRVRHIEDDHQKALMDWAKVARLRGILVADFLIAIPNGGNRNPKEAARLKAQGVKAGVSDLFLALPANGACGLWIELKAPKTATTKAGKPSQSQIDWLESMAQVGYAARLCYGWQAAKQTIQEYLA
jgi:hypothetical protein